MSGIPTIASLIKQPTQDEWTAIALASLAGKGFPTTDWTSTSPERAMLETDTACLADQSQQIPLLLSLTLVWYAQDPTQATLPASDTLQFVAYYWYQLVATQPTPAVGSIVLASQSTSGANAIAAGQLIAVDDTGRYLYTNITSGSLGPSASTTLLFKCLTPGSVGNVASGAIRTLQTPLPGVSAFNAATKYSAIAHTGSGTGTLTLAGSPSTTHSVTVRIDTSGASGAATWSTSLDGGAYSSQGNAGSITNLGGFAINIALVDGLGVPTFVAGDTYAFQTPGSWLTSQGTDLETQGSLVARCLARWPSLSAIPTTDVYTAWAIESIPGQITRVAVEANPSVAATVDVYIAGPTQAASTAQVNQCQQYITARKPITDLAVVHAASTLPVAITGTATYPAGSPGIVADRNDAIVSYVNSLFGGTTAGTVEIAQITALAMNLNASGIPQGALNVTVPIQLNAAALDIALAAHTIPTVTNSLVWTAV